MYRLWDVPFVVMLFIGHFLTAVIPYYFLLLLGMKKAASKTLYAMTRFFANLVLWSLGVKLHISKNPEAEQLINSGERVCFISNHTSLLDTPAVFIATEAELGFVVKRAVIFVPLLNLATFAMKCVFIVRSDIKNSIRGIERGVQIIESGHSMLIFPEGTRSKTGEIATFKRGAFRLASESDSYVVPITLKGLRQANEWRSEFFGKYDAYISIGNPVKMSSGDSREERFAKIDMIEKDIRETYASLGDK